MPPFDRTLTVLIPGLCGLPGADAPVLTVPGLTFVVARADRERTPATGLESLLFALFGLAAGDEDLPVASVTRVLDMGVVDKSWWIRADPVHLQPDRDRLLLSDNELLRITPAEAEQIVGEILETFGADGWVLKAARPGRWYLRPPRAARLRTTPLPDVVGRDIHPHLPRGKDGKQWHTILNEVQILLHTSRVNEAREARGELPINSLWFWGSGKLPSLRPAAWTHVWSQEPVSLALARLAGVTSRGLPANFAEWSHHSSPSGAHLVVLDQARAPVQYGQYEAWRDTIEHLDREWLAPVVQAIRRRELHTFRLYDDQGRGFCLTSRGARRWWRRRVEFPRCCHT